MLVRQGQPLRSGDWHVTMGAYWAELRTHTAALASGFWKPDSGS